MLERLATCLLAAGAVAAVAVEVAAACTLALDHRGLRADLAAADAAFVGVVVSRRDPGPDGLDTVTYTFRVERVVKGSFGETVDVVTAPHSAACGFGAEIGQRIGLLLHGNAVRWTAWLWDLVEPNRLIALSGELPPVSQANRPLPEAARSNGYAWLVLPAAAVALAAAAGMGAAVRRRPARTQG